MKEILAILENDARVTTEEIAKMTGYSVEEVNEKIKQAQNDGTIVKYKAIINWEHISGEEVQAIIEIRVTPQIDVGFHGIAQKISRFPEVRSLSLMSGNYDLSVLVSGVSIQEIASFVATKLATIAEVLGTTTHFLLKRYKEDGVILEAEPGNKRLPLSP